MSEKSLRDQPMASDNVDGPRATLGVEAEKPSASSAVVQNEEAGGIGLESPGDSCEVDDKSSSPAHGDSVPGSTAKRAKSRFRTARGWVALACVVFVLVGLAFHVGIGTPSAFGIQQISAICPLGALETMAGAHGVMLHPLLLLVLVVVLIALVGKAFCAWMCPMPWLQKFFSPKKKNGNAPSSASKTSAAHSSCAACPGAAACGKALAPVGGKRDGVQFDSRHAVLVGTLASAAVFGFPVFCLICPVGLTFATIIGLWNLVQFDEPTWALIIFPIILILEVTVLRKWCSKICPISALVGLLSNLNVTLRPRVKTDTCLRTRGIDCHACVDACPEQLDPHSKRIPECSKCGACVEACPAKAISIKLLK